MSQTTDLTAAHLLAKLALADGFIDPYEKELLQDSLSQINNVLDVDALIESSKSTNIDDLCNQLNNEADRFFILVRCHLMVSIDDEVTDSEQKMLERILNRLPIGEHLVPLLDAVLEHELDEGPAPDLNAIETLFAKTTFAKA